MELRCRLLSEQYERLKSFFDNSDDVVLCGELMAYSNELEKLENELKNIFNHIYVESDECDLKYLINLVDADETLTESDIKSEIKKRFSEKYGEYTKSEFLRQFEMIGDGEYESNDGENIFRSFSCEHLNDLCKFVSNHLFILADFKYDGDGFSYDDFDERDFSFVELDNFDLMFNLLDTLDVVIFENKEE